MIRSTANAVGAATLILSIAACGQRRPRSDEPGALQLAIVNQPVAGTSSLIVMTPAFPADGDIPFENTQYRGNVFPGLSWSAGPAGTRSYAAIMQDGDALPNGSPYLHWTMANIPPNVTSLAPGMSAPPAGATYGPNIKGPDQPYSGPKTPPGPKHRYHFQVFALDTTLGPDALASYAAMMAAMKGHVLASGQVVGLGHAAPAAK